MVISDASVDPLFGLCGCFNIVACWYKTLVLILNGISERLNLILIEWYKRVEVLFFIQVH